MIDLAAKSNGAKPRASRGRFQVAWTLACSCAFSVMLGCAAEVDEVSHVGLGGTGGVSESTSSSSGCLQGYPLRSRVGGEGLDYPDGTAVRAHFAVSPETSDSATDTLEAGAFSFSFFFPSDLCNLGATDHGGGALYIDVDGNGECNVTEDDIFVWTARSGPIGTNPLVSFSPASSRCIGVGGEGDADALAAAQQLCPSVGECLAFCGPGPMSASGDSVPFCPAPDAGAPDAGDADASQPDAGE